MPPTDQLKLIVLKPHDSSGRKDRPNVPPTIRRHITPHDQTLLIDLRPVWFYPYQVIEAGGPNPICPIQSQGIDAGSEVAVERKLPRNERTNVSLFGAHPQGVG